MSKEDLLHPGKRVRNEILAAILCVMGTAGMTVVVVHVLSKTETPNATYTNSTATNAATPFHSEVRIPSK